MNFNKSIGKENINKTQEKSSELIINNQNLNSELISNVEKEDTIKAININESLIVNQDTDNLKSYNNKENIEKKSQLIAVLKNILTIDIIMSLKVLKNDIKEYFEKHSIYYFNNSDDFDISFIGVQEQNIKFTEFLKLGIFNDIYENILSKYFNEFYKNIFIDKDFLGSLEKILVHYFKINNKLEEKESKIIDFNDIIKTFAQKN